MDPNVLALFQRRAAPDPGVLTQSDMFGVDNLGGMVNSAMAASLAQDKLSGAAGMRQFALQDARDARNAIRRDRLARRRDALMFKREQIKEQARDERLDTRLRANWDRQSRQLDSHIKAVDQQLAAAQKRSETNNAIKILMAAAKYQEAARPPEGAPEGPPEGMKQLANQAAARLGVALPYPPPAPAPQGTRPETKPAGGDAGGMWEWLGSALRDWWTLTPPAALMNVSPAAGLAGKAAPRPRPKTLPDDPLGLRGGK
jgi:hypothetical protein